MNYKVVFTVLLLSYLSDIVLFYLGASVALSNGTNSLLLIGILVILATFLAHLFCVIKGLLDGRKSQHYSAWWKATIVFFGIVFISLGFYLYTRITYGLLF